MWAQQWNSLQDLLMPYPDKPILDVTAEMVKQVGYFRVAPSPTRSLAGRTHNYATLSCNMDLKLLLFVFCRVFLCVLYCPNENFHLGNSAIFSLRKASCDKVALPMNEFLTLVECL